MVTSVAPTVPMISTKMLWLALPATLLVPNAQDLLPKIAPNVLQGSFFVMEINVVLLSVRADSLLLISLASLVTQAVLAVMEVERTNAHPVLLDSL